MWDPGDDRLSRDCTIMGPAGLTAVFGMGTGVAPPVWSPGSRPAGLFGAAGRWDPGGSVRSGRLFCHTGGDGAPGRRVGAAAGSSHRVFTESWTNSSAGQCNAVQFDSIQGRTREPERSWTVRRPAVPVPVSDVVGTDRRRVGVVKPLGC